MMDDPTFPATHIVHWPTGPVTVCAKHAKQLMAIGKALGTYIAVSIIDESLNKSPKCSNCYNEHVEKTPSGEPK